jgi:DNA adenine methylase
VRDFLTQNGAKLARDGAGFYYTVRRQFNEEGGSLRFLFLNRSCFNGVMRFNSRGGFNVPFGHKPKRFSQAYVTKITNQVARAAEAMAGRDWVFKTQTWNTTLNTCAENDFAYLDPPYIGRHTDYYNRWTDADAEALAHAARVLPCGVALSMWKENKYRENGHLGEHWAGYVLRTFSHFYHVGPTEDLRNQMTEVLAIRPGFDVAAGPETRKRETLGHTTRRAMLPSSSAQLAFVLRDASRKLRGSSAVNRRTIVTSDAVAVSDKPRKRKER